MFSRQRSIDFEQIFILIINEALFLRLVLVFLVICFAAGNGSLLLASNAVAGAAQNGKMRKQAEKAMRRGEFETAINLWQEILRLEPENTDYRLRLSYALYKQRRLLESYQEAMIVSKTDPASARVRSLVGSVYLLAGRMEEARTLLIDALARDHREALALASLAMLDFYENRSRSGLEKLRSAVSLDPSEPDFLFALAQVAARLESYKEAADAYEMFLRVAPRTDIDRRARIEGLIAFLRYIGKIKSLYEVGGKPQTTVACQIVNNRPIVEVRLNNSPDSFRFVIDTGSGMTVISERTAERLGLSPIARGGMARAVGGSGKFQMVYGFLKSLGIGTIRIARVPVYIRKFNESGDQIDGYLGISAVSSYLATLDYREKVFSLARNNLARNNNENEKKNITPVSLIDNRGSDWLNVPLKITLSGFLSSQVKVEGVAEPLNFIVDTGASVSVVSAAAARRDDISHFSQATKLSVFGAAGITENVATLILPRLSLGSINRAEVLAAILDLDPINETAGFEQAGILGGNFLQHYRLTFNFKDLTILFEPSATQNAP